MSGISSVNSNASYYANSSTQTNSIQSNPVASAGSTASASAASVVNTTRLNKEISDFNKALQDLTKSLPVFSGSNLFDQMYKDKSGDPFRDLAYTATNKLVKAYNQLNGAVKSSQFITSDGKKLLDQVKSLLTGPDAAKFADMGISLDKTSGQIKLDDIKFADFVSKDPDSVYSLLKNKDKLVDVMRDVVGNTSGKQENYYFYKPFQATV
jgi:flagellar capping protein FliD